MTTKLSILVLAVTLISGGAVHAQSEAPPPAGKPVPVTVENFIRAETDTYFAGFAKQGGLGKFKHSCDLPLEDRGVRSNRDTLYSLGVFDLDAGPVTITLPDAGKRFMSMLIIDEDHYAIEVNYGAGRHTYTREQIGTRYLFASVRTLVDPADPNDMEAGRALQDAIKVDQPGGPGRIEVPNWDPVSQKKERDALLVLNDTLPDLGRAAGRRGEVDPVRRLIAAASYWGLNPDKDAIYLNVTPTQNDGKTVYQLTVKDVPVDAFWSVTVYDATGHFQKNEHNAYSLNSITAKKGEDGSVTIQFGGCDGKTPNCLPTPQGWNYTVRLYRPRAEILNGTWKFPEAQPVP